MGHTHTHSDKSVDGGEIQVPAACCTVQRSASLQPQTGDKGVNGRQGEKQRWSRL